MNTRFDPAALEDRFAALDQLPRALWLPAIINTEGRMVPRLPMLVAALARLQRGEGPFEDRDGWPAPEVAEAFDAALRRLDALGLAQGSESVAVQLLRQMLWHIDRIAQRSEVVSRAQAIRDCARAFADDFERTGEELREVLRVFESLEGVANFARWTEVRGLLRSQAWQAVLAAHRHIAALPRLAALLRRLGRSRPQETLAPTEVARPASQVAAPQWVRRVREVEFQGAPLESEGVRRAGDLARMLPSEALLWRRRRRWLAARLAEQTLLAYQFRQFTAEPASVREPGWAAVPQPQPRPVLEQGPLIVCVDTSASMAGAPECVAKAIVFEAMRSAAHGGRECRVFAFSGPGDLDEFELARDVDGLMAAAGFLGRSFHGGTDVCEPFERALAAIEHSRWSRADLLLATDGEFGAPAAIVERLRAAKRTLGLRVQGVLIGDRETIGLAEVCDEIFWVDDWRRFGGHGQVQAPISSSTLTARFFPGALVGRVEPADSPARPPPN